MIPRVTSGNGDQEDLEDEFVAYCGECSWFTTAASEADATLMVQLHVAAAHAKKG